MKSDHSLDLPRRLQIEFSQVVQSKTDSEGGEVTPEAMWQIFEDEYLPSARASWGRFSLRSMSQSSNVEGVNTLEVTLFDLGTEVVLKGEGNGPIAAFCDALAQHGVDVRVLDYAEHAMSAGGDARAAAYLECAVEGKVLWGVGIDPNILTASLKAVVSAVNRAIR